MRSLFSSKTWFSACLFFHRHSERQLFSILRWRLLHVETTPPPPLHFFRRRLRSWPIFPTCATMWLMERWMRHRHPFPAAERMARAPGTKHSGRGAYGKAAVFYLLLFQMFFLACVFGIFLECNALCNITLDRYQWGFGVCG